jgi:hypothetical protein
VRVDPRLYRLGVTSVLFWMAGWSSAAGQTVTASAAGQPMPGNRLIASTVGFSDSTNSGTDRAPIGPPTGLHVDDALRPVLHHLWQRSPAFRRQCARLAEASVELTVQIGLPRGAIGVRALSRIKVQDGAVRHVTVYLGPTFDNAYELLPHEIEHVLEQIDGVNLRVLAFAGVLGVRAYSDSYETSRAAAIGRLVEREVFGRKAARGR